MRFTGVSKMHQRSFNIIPRIALFTCQKAADLIYNEDFYGEVPEIVVIPPDVDSLSDEEYINEDLTVEKGPSEVISDIVGTRSEQ